MSDLHLSRRALLAGATLAAARPSPAQPGGNLAYVGTGTERGKGIHLFRVDRSSGVLTEIKVAAETPNPTWLEFDRSGRFLYCVNSGRKGTVSAFAVDRSSGDLKFINSASSEGGGPTHLSVAGNWILVANYTGGNVAVLPIRPDGSLGAATDVKRHEGPLGPVKPAAAPRGSFAFSGHEGPHPHMIIPDPANRFAFSADLGTDRIFIWKLDTATGKLTPNEPPFAQAGPGAGPRHMAFHPNGRWFYSINEEDSTLSFFAYDPSRGTLQPGRTLSTLPQGFAGTNFTSGILVTPNGRYVYGLNRIHDSTAIFAIDPRSGDIQWAGEEWTRGDYPRHFSIDPAGRFLYVLNQRADHITAFRLEDGGRRLAFTGQYTPIGDPNRMLFF